MKSILRVAAGILFVFFLPSAWCETEPLPPLVAGSQLDTLMVGKNSFHQVRIQSINARTAVIVHSTGIASIRLRELSPELQARFHYDPAAELAAETASAQTQTRPTPIAPAKPKPAQSISKFERLLKEFGEPATLKNEVDLRPKFFQMDLWVKNQGFRPSCSVFAVVGALEFQNAELTGKAEKLSEEYLLWAVQKTLHRPAPSLEPSSNEAGGTTENRDVGFSLSEVVSALRAYGIPLQSTMPNTIGRKLSDIEEPSPEVVREARTHQHVYVYQIPGRDQSTAINNIFLALNKGIPVVIGIGWPHANTLRNAYLSEQKPLPNSGHAVTLVGYRSATGKMEDAVFIFKNSWGKDWGQGGYGIATYGYLKKSIQAAVILEVQRS